LSFNIWLTLVMAAFAITLCVMNQKLNRVLKKEDQIMKDLQPIIDKVTAISTVIDSAVAAFTLIGQELLDNQNDPAAIAEIASNLQAKADQLAAAVAAVPVINTPPAPPVG
jgi:hypothetical protein